MDLDVATITAMGTAAATVILSIGPLVRAIKDPGTAHPIDTGVTLGVARTLEAPKGN